jgi:hypothetical protein
MLFGAHQGAASIQRKRKSDTSVNFEVEVLAPLRLERALSKAKRVDDQRPSCRAPRP